MSNINEILSKIGCILNSEIIVISSDVVYMYPNNSVDINFLDVKNNVNCNHMGFNVYSISLQDYDYYLLIKSDYYYFDNSIKIALSMVELSLKYNFSSYNKIKDLISNNYDSSLLDELYQEYFDIKDCYFILINYVEEFKEEYKEIIKNSLDIYLFFEYNNKFVSIVKNDNIEDSCNNLASIIVSELFTEPTIAIGGKIDDIKNLHVLYKNCIGCLDLKYDFNVFDYVISYDKLMLYRICSSLDESVKNYIFNKIFNSDFNNILDKELETTVEAFYKNNLNITDTANSIHIHRNTLLYRLEKIQKHTSFDLKKFEDSFIFKLAWLIKKELSQK